MEKIQLTKIKLAIVFLFGLGISYLGWQVIQPSVEHEPLTILSHSQPVMVILIALVLVITSGIFGQFFGTIEELSIGIFAVPAVFCFWIFQSGGSNQLLQGLPEIGQRTEMFYRFIPEVLIWTAILYAGFAVVQLIQRRKKTVAPLKSTPESKKKVALWETPLFTAAAVVVVCSIVSVILLKIFMQSGAAWTQGALRYAVSYAPEKGQVLFAIYISFFLATFGVKYLYQVPIGYFLAVPAIVAVFTYLYIAQKHLPQELLDRAPEMILPAMRFGMILPIEFLVVGWLAVIIGFWSQMPINTQESW